MGNSEIETLLANRFRKRVRKDRNIQNAYLLIHSEKQGVHLNLAEGATDGKSAHPEQPFFIASIDKTFTSVLIGMLMERGILSYTDPITSHLDFDLIHNLYRYKGKDYTGNIQIKHLLNHTSGLYDFVEDKQRQGGRMIDTFLEESPNLLAQQGIIQYSKEHFTSHFPPGEGFHYTDTGYYILNLIIEKIIGKPYPEVLKDELFQPLGMNYSYMMRYSEPIEKSQYPAAHCYIQNFNVIQDKNLGIDYAGGRIVCTTEDLLKFIKALAEYKLLCKETTEKMKDWAKFSVGIDYGYGIMNFKHVPVLMPGKFSVWGNAGSTGSFMFIIIPFAFHAQGTTPHENEAFRLLYFVIK